MDDMNNAIRKYLVKSNRTVLDVLPAQTAAGETEKEEA